MALKAKRKTGFMDLPLELRREIYRYRFQDFPSPFKVNLNCSLSGNGLCYTLDLHNYLDRLYRELLKTSHQIREEIYDLVCAETTLAFWYICKLNSTDSKADAPFFQRARKVSVLLSNHNQQLKNLRHLLNSEFRPGSLVRLTIEVPPEFQESWLPRILHFVEGIQDVLALKTRIEIESLVGRSSMAHVEMMETIERQLGEGWNVRPSYARQSAGFLQHSVQNDMTPWVFERV